MFTQTQLAFTFVSLVSLVKNTNCNRLERDLPAVQPPGWLQKTTKKHKARSYKNYTQQVRLKSWRYPKGGISLSTEVVFFSLFLFKFAFHFSLWGARGRGRAPLACPANNREWSYGVGVFAVQVHASPLLSSTLGKRLDLRQTQPEFKEGFGKRAATFLVCFGSHQTETVGSVGNPECGRASPDTLSTCGYFFQGASWISQEVKSTLQRGTSARAFPISSWTRLPSRRGWFSTPPSAL